MSQPQESIHQSSGREKSLVVVTGANGFIATHIIHSLLLLGYPVRGTVRSVSRSRGLLATDSPLTPFALRDQFTLVEVPDITVPGAFDKALEGNAGSIIHLAQAIQVGEGADTSYVIETAVKGTKSILDSAKRVESLKSFILMSSIAAMGLSSDNPDEPVTASNWSNADLQAQALINQGKAVPPVLAYLASKTAGERALWKFYEDEKPSFSVLSLNPSFVAGPPLLPLSKPEDINNTSKFIYDIFKNGNIPPREALIGYGPYVDVRDVASLTVYGVERPDLANGQRLLATSSWVHPQGVVDLLRKEYPDKNELIPKGSPGEGYIEGFKFLPDGPQYKPVDLKQVTGKEWINFKQTVLDIARSYEHL